jgi:uroporphyrinogen-III decarboxylase
MMVMTPRERVLAALEHREPDRVPIDLGSCHDIEADVPGENVQALFQAAQRWGRYPLHIS